MMPNTKKGLPTFKKSYLQPVGFLLLLLLAAILLLFCSLNNNQASGATMAKVRFVGDYRIGDDSQWQKITEGKHISSTKGDVTLRGNFHLYSPGGEYIGFYTSSAPIAFYTNHIRLTFFDSEGKSYIADHENPIFGKYACGEDWTAHNIARYGTEPFEIVVQNPHRFGNENAVDEMLSSISIWGNLDFEKGIMESGKTQRYTGLFFIIISLLLLGSGLFSTLLHLQNHSIIWLLGLTILSAGFYLAYSATGVSFWSEIISVNTCILGISKIFYMLLVSGIITYFLKNSKVIGNVLTAALGIADGILIALPLFTDIYFYDLWLPWVILQSVINAVLLVCLIKEYISSSRNERLFLIEMALLLIAFVVDVIATAFGWWEGGLISKYVFFVLFVAALFVVLRQIPESINAAEKTKELELHRSRLEAEKNIVEAELKDSRISLMLSQIQPHFIYNTLGTIERMCLKDPQKAFDLVRNFSLYLRGNFSELDNVAPIRFSDELKHVEYYVNIEMVRFPDMEIKYEVETTDFVLPALSVQPLVENAIKHGLMRLETGGTVIVHSYETPTHFCVKVKDNGVGFDTSLPIEEKKHVGLRNIRGRLQAMMNGDLILESAPGEGTTAIIMIPKEVTK